MSEEKRQPGILCISTYEKGQAFLKEAARLGCVVTLLTVDSLRNADWPKESLAELLTMPEGLTPTQVLNTVCYMARGRKFDRIVALDEFDLETAALLREHMRLPGMGETATRFFRDKLAMRVKAAQAGVAVPDFTGVFNYDDYRAFMANVPGPWLLKPRTNASAIGIKPIEEPDSSGRSRSAGRCRPALCAGALRPGRGVSRRRRHLEGEILFAAPHKYGKHPRCRRCIRGAFLQREHSPPSPRMRNLCVRFMRRR
jgi:hypothetical protein